jgi:hypothetical protein
MAPKGGPLARATSCPFTSRVDSLTAGTSREKRLVRTLVNGVPAAGRKTVAWDGLNDAGITAATGIYLYRLTGPGFVQTRKMMLLK